MSSSRVKRIRDFILQGHAIPGAIIISCDRATYKDRALTISNKPNAAWIIDGQHRTAGAAEAAKKGTDIYFPVVAFSGLDEQQQADYFVTINREAKGVPSSLYLDLLRHLPKVKTEKEQLEERISDISRELTRNSESIFFQRVISTTSPKVGQVSLTNFARRMRPIFSSHTGLLSTYTIYEQVKIIENYFTALKTVFPKPFASNVFFKGSIRELYAFVIDCLERQEVGLWTSGVSRCGFRRRAG